MRYDMLPINIFMINLLDVNNKISLTFFLMLRFSFLDVIAVLPGTTNPLFTVLIEFVILALSPQSISSDPAHPVMNSMMSVPITPLIPSTPPPINSQLDQNNQTMMTSINPRSSIQGQSPSPNNQIKSIAIKRENACMYCGLDTPKQKKGRIEHLLKCKECVNIGNC